MTKHLQSQGLIFSVADAEATVQSDKDLILGLVEKSMGIKQFQDSIWEKLTDALRVKRSVEAQGTYPCFAGDGLVQMADGSFKLVQ